MTEVLELQLTCKEDFYVTHACLKAGYGTLENGMVVPIECYLDEHHDEIERSEALEAEDPNMAISVHGVRFGPLKLDGRDIYSDVQLDYLILQELQ